MHSLRQATGSLSSQLGALGVEARSEISMLQQSLNTAREKRDAFEVRSETLAQELSEEKGNSDRLRKELNALRQQSSEEIARLKNDVTLLCRNIESSNAVLNMRSKDRGGDRNPPAVTKADAVRQQIGQFQHQKAVQNAEMELAQLAAAQQQQLTRLHQHHIGHGNKQQRKMNSHQEHLDCNGSYQNHDELIDENAENIARTLKSRRLQRIEQQLQKQHGESNPVCTGDHNHNEAATTSRQILARGRPTES